ncbi:hypothetical protein DH2020_044632 [Rehmannia glutinosa]|uniref:Uncharacterized protein n=1 Tax=Rehmannia glutinosa TaxID=99300 RepID=A0ABR0UGD7_REHGL
MTVIDGESPAEKPIEIRRKGIFRYQQDQSTGIFPGRTTRFADQFWKKIDQDLRFVISCELAQDSLQDLKSDYSTYEDIVFGKIKEGFLYASSRPLITTGAVVGVGFLGLKTLLSRADTKVKELRQSIDLLKAESEKGPIKEKALQAEEDLVRGRTKLRQAGKQIQGVINSAYKIERQARGLKDVLRELPSREASRFRTQVTNLAKEAKKERNAMSRKLPRSATMGSQSKSPTGFGFLSVDIKPILFALYDLVFGFK